jgi:hypothetical protein
MVAADDEAGDSCPLDREAGDGIDVCPLLGRGPTGLRVDHSTELASPSVTKVAYGIVDKTSTDTGDMKWIVRT